MFTGIVETQGVIKKIKTKGSNTSFWIKSPVSSKLKIDQSVCHNGVCLTIENIKGNSHQVTAIEETIQKTTLGKWQLGEIINLERSLKISDRLDGHFVQGHVDSVGTCVGMEDKNGSMEIVIEFPEKYNEQVIEKGSITIDGISLTAFQVTKNTFRVAIIPYTLDHTNLKQIIPGSQVNLEFDLLGKYILRKLSLGK